MLGAFAQAIANIAKIFANKTDGENLQKLNIAKDYKDTEKAMEAAEKHMFAVGSFLDHNLDEDQLERLHKKYSKLYFRYN